MQVTSVNGRQITATILSQVGSISKNDLCVRIGNTTNTARQGSVYLTSDDTNSPYIDVVDGVNSTIAWGGIDKIKLRLGKLNGITDDYFGPLTGYGLYAKDNAYIRGKIFAKAGGWIAGWSINANSLDAPVVYINNAMHELSLQASDDRIGLYLQSERHNNIISYLSIGRIVDGEGSLQNNFGIAYKQVDNTYFELSDTNKQIAGWLFDNSKLYSGSVSLIASNEMTGLAVGNDNIKIGLFNHGTMSNNRSNINTIVLNGYEGIDPRDGAWIISGKYFIGNKQYTPQLNISDNYLNSVIGCECSSWSYSITRRLFGHTDYLLGRHLRLKCKVYFTLGYEFLAYSGGDFSITINYHNGVGNVVYSQKIYSEFIPDNLNDTLIIDLGSGLDIILPAHIPSVETVHIGFHFSGGAQTGTYYPYDMDVSDFVIESYIGYKTWINNDGFWLYNSPNNYIKLFHQFSEIQVPILKVRGKQVVRFHGRLGNTPLEDVELGDLFINSNDNKVYICNHINTEGIPIWTQI